VELTMPGRSSPVHGWSQAFVLARLVVVVWLVSLAVFAPLRVVLYSALWSTMASLPEGPLPPGEVALIAVELVRPVWVPAAAALLSGWLALWAWTVLWHAGVVRWVVYSGRRDVRLAELLSRGLFGWWRWARLSLVSVSVGVGVHISLWIGFSTAQSRAAATGSDALLGWVLLAAAVLSVGTTVLSWLASLRGAWLLGDSRRRSAVVAWLAGLWGTVRRPLSSLLTLVVWVLPALAAAALPLVAGWRFELARGPLTGAALTGGAGLLTAFCLVGLFLSFAPVTGLEDDPGRTSV
jgi:hypothetical protein